MSMSNEYYMSGANAVGDFKMSLPVSDIVRLAASGVQFAPLDVIPVVDPLSYAPQREAVMPRTLVDLFWDRYKRAEQARPDRGFGELTPFTLYAYEYGQIVYVLFCPLDAVPFIIEDAAPCFPSDALMAKVALYKGTTK